MTADRALLITMPFGPMTRPAIGISLLKAELAEAGIGCDIRYLNLEYARLVGEHTYHELSEDLPTSSLFGDWLFYHLIFEADEESDREYLEQYLPKWYPGTFDHARLELYQECRLLSAPFIERCLKLINLNEYRVVGFTTTFQQTMASLALAKRIKEAQPTFEIVFGGANCEGVMGQEILRNFDFVDAVFSGEADISFPQYVAALFSGSQNLKRLPGVTRRSDRLSQHLPASSGPPAAVNSLPFPDYRDFEEALDRTCLRGRFNVQHLIEASRGCWWGERHHCTFCGLNGQTMHYRSKDPDRVMAELMHLRESYGADVVWGTDNILDHHYFDTLLPRLAASELNMRLFFETKANIRKDQLALMKQAGLTWFQPGIESLNTHQLAIMRKGVKALQNIQLLKWAREFGMSVTWNVLMGFPGETPEDYKLAAAYCERIEHLQPPAGAHPIRLDRFSPFFDDPKTFGLTNVEPYPSYRYVYHIAPQNLRRLAYFFTFDYVDSYDPMWPANRFSMRYGAGHVPTA